MNSMGSGSTVAEPKSRLTSARMFDTTTDAALADWLDTDAAMLDGRPGLNDHVAACRAAAERLRSVPFEESRSRE